MNNWEQDFQTFLSAQGATEHKNPPAPILKDLVGSRWRLGWTYAVASVVGYLVSLALCAQCSIGLTKFSWHTSAFIHSMPDPWCPLLCGFLFGVFPVLASSLLLSRFQHRYLLFKLFALPLILPFVANLVMMFIGPPHGFVWYALWFAAASLTPYLIEGLWGLRLRQRRWTQSV